MRRVDATLTLAAVLLAGAALASAAAGAGRPKADEHREPERAVEPAAVDVKQRLLSEMWQRRILSSDFTAYGSADLALLTRMHNAEDAGAVALLRRTYKGLQGLAVPYRPAGELQPRLRLTKEGFDKYLFLRSQQALDYFQRREIEAKWSFQLRDMTDQKLFAPDGLLTEAGEALFNAAEAGRAVAWKLPDGTVQGSRPMRPAAAVAARPAAAGQAPAQPQAPTESSEPELSAAKTLSEKPAQGQGQAAPQAPAQPPAAAAGAEQAPAAGAGPAPAGAESSAD